MQYLLIAAITVISLCIWTLVTQSRGWGFISRMIWLIIYVVIYLWCILAYRKQTTIKILGNFWIILWVWLLAWLVTRIRLWNHDTHCRQTPNIIQWQVTVDQIWKAGESILVSQWDYHWIYRSSKTWLVWQSLYLYGVTDTLQTCITTYTHIDIGLKQLWSWIKGGDFDYNKRLVMKWVDGYLQGKILQDKWKEQGKVIQEWMTESNEEDIVNPTNSINKSQTHKSEFSLSNFKNLIISQIATLFPDSRSAWRVGGTLIGDKSMIADSDYDLLINSGLVHLIVVSGGNLALIILILWLILARIPLYLRYWLIILWLIWYVIIVWTDSSVVRALLMSLMTIGGIVLGRKRSFSGMLCIALVGLLRYQPLMIDDVWLRLSFGAVVGIYILYHWTSWMSMHRQKWRTVQSARNIILVIMASIGAWLGTVPVLIWQFGSANLSSVAANSVTGIIASATTVIELIIIGLSSIAPILAVIPIWWWVWVINLLVSVIYRIAKLTVDRWIWIGVSSGRWMLIILSSVIWIFGLLYHHTQKLRIEYLLEIESDD